MWMTLIIWTDSRRAINHGSNASRETTTRIPRACLHVRDIAHDESTLSGDVCDALGHQNEAIPERAGCK